MSLSPVLQLCRALKSRFFAGDIPPHVAITGIRLFHSTQFIDIESASAKRQDSPPAKRCLEWGQKSGLSVLMGVNIGSGDIWGFLAVDRGWSGCLPRVEVPRHSASFRRDSGSDERPLCPVSMTKVQQWDPACSRSAVNGHYSWYPRAGHPISPPLLLPLFFFSGNGRYTRIVRHGR